MEETIISDASGLLPSALPSVLRAVYGTDHLDRCSAFSILRASQNSTTTTTTSEGRGGDPSQAMQRALTQFFSDSSRSPSTPHDLLRHMIDAHGGGQASCAGSSGRGAAASGKLPSVFSKLPPVAVMGLLDVRRERPQAELQLFPGVHAAPGGNGAAWLRDGGLESHSMEGHSGFGDHLGRSGGVSSSSSGGMTVVPRHGVAAALECSGPGSSPVRRAFMTAGSGGGGVNGDGDGFAFPSMGHLVLNLSSSRDDATIASVATLLTSTLVIVGTSEECYHALHRLSQMVVASKAAASAVKPTLSASGSAMASELTLILTSPGDAAVADLRSGMGSSNASRRSTVEASLKMLGHGIAATVRVVDLLYDATSAGMPAHRHQRQVGSPSSLRGSASGRETLAVQQEVGRAIARSRPNTLRHDRPALNACQWFQMLAAVLSRSGGGVVMSPSRQAAEVGLDAQSLAEIASSAVGWSTACYQTLLDLLSPLASHDGGTPATATLGASCEDIHGLAKWIALDFFRELSDPLVLPGHPLEQVQANIHLAYSTFQTHVKEQVYLAAHPLLRQCLTSLSLPLKLLCDGDLSSSITSVSEWMLLVEQAVRAFMRHRLHDNGATTLDPLGSAGSGGGGASSSLRPCSRWSEQAKRSAVYDMAMDWILPNTRVVGEILAEKDALLLHHKDSVIRQGNAAIADLESAAAESVAERKKLLDHELDVKGKLDAALRRIHEAQRIAMQLCASLSAELSELHRRAVDAAFLAENGAGPPSSVEYDSPRSSDGEPHAEATDGDDSEDGDENEDLLLPRKAAKTTTGLLKAKRRTKFADADARIASTAAALDMCRALLATLGTPAALIQAHVPLGTMGPHPTSLPSSPSKALIAITSGGTHMRSLFASASAGSSPTGASRRSGGLNRSSRVATAAFSTTATAASSTTTLNQSGVSFATTSGNASSSTDVGNAYATAAKAQTSSIRDLRRREQRRVAEEQRLRALRISSNPPSSLNTSVEASDGTGGRGTGIGFRMPAGSKGGGILTVTSTDQQQQQQALFVTRAASAHDHHHQHLVELREQHAATMRQLSDLQQTHAQCRATERRLDGHVATLESQLRGYAIDNTVLSTKNLELQEVIESLRIALDKSGAMLDAESSKLSATQALHQELRDVVTTHEVNVFGLAEFKKTASVDLERHGQRVAELEAHNAQLTSLLEGAVKDRSLSQSLLDLTRVELEVDRSALQQSRADTAQLEQLLTQQRATLRDSAAKYERHIAELLEKTDTTTERLRQQVAVLERSTLELTQQLRAKEETHSAENTVLVTSREELTAQRQRLLVETSELTRRCEALEKALHDATNHRKQQSTALEQDHASIAILKKELAFAKDNIAKLSGELRHSEDLRGRLQHSVEAFDTLITEQRQLSATDTAHLQGIYTTGVAADPNMLTSGEVLYNSRAPPPMPPPPPQVRSTLSQEGSASSTPQLYRPAVDARAVYRQRHLLHNDHYQQQQQPNNANANMSVGSTATDELQRLTDGLRRDVAASLDEHHSLFQQTGVAQRGGAQAAGRSMDTSLVDDQPIGLQRLMRDDANGSSTLKASSGSTLAEVGMSRDQHQQQLFSSTTGVTRRTTTTTRDTLQTANDIADAYSGYHTPMVMLDSASTSFVQPPPIALLQRRVPVPMPVLAVPRSTSSGVRPIEPHLRVLAQVDALIPR